jgi:drug/metabolite transporter (DMT)-like permease
VKKAYLELHLAVFLFGFTAILGKLISLSELPLVWYRLLLTCPALLLIIFFTNRSFQLPWKEIGKLAGIGVLVSLHWLTFYGSIKASNASVTLSCLAATTLFTSILEPLIIGRKFRWYEAGIGVFIIIGIYLIFTFQQMFLTGILLGLLSAFLAALFSVLNKKLISSHDTYVVTFYELSAGFLFLSLLIPIYYWNTPSIVLIPDGMDWIWLGILAWLCTVLAYTLSLNALRYISAFTSNLTINLEPVYGIVLAWFILQEHEQLQAGFYVGTGIILSSVGLYPIIKSTMERRSNQ